jgi:hypothetical protein
MTVLGENKSKFIARAYALRLYLDSLRDGLSTLIGRVENEDNEETPPRLQVLLAMANRASEELDDLDEFADAVVDRGEHIDVEKFDLVMEALEFYADEANWRRSRASKPSLIESDNNGDLARRTIAKLDRKPG